MDAARARFIAHSYDDVGLREIARDAGVDPALINRYFGSKEDLFGSVLESCDDGPDCPHVQEQEEQLWSDRPNFGLRLASHIVHERRPEKLRRLLIILRSIGSAKALEIVREGMVEHFMTPFRDWIDRPDAAVRVNLAVGLIMGMTLVRELGHGFDLSDDEREVLCQRLAVILQALIDD